MRNQFGLQAIGLVIGIVVVLIIVGGAYVLFIRDDATVENTNRAAGTNSSAINQGVGTSTAPAGTYTAYSASAYTAAAGQTRVFFFHAGWCPTCRIAHEDIMAHLSTIPENVVILKTDYDTETALKEQYGVTYQHTFVQVDAQGNALKKWNGGGLDQIIQNII